ncbi:MAG: purine-nucleoside phosphorylase [Syntrophobacteraceae bacterium]
MEGFKRKVEEAAAFVQPYLDGAPEVGLILGTGLGGIVEGMERSVSLACETIPHYPVSTVESHSGRLVYGKWGGKAVIAMQGRVHLYEGYSALDVSFPVRVLRALGVKILVISNAAGGLNPDFQPGDLMLVTDHINLTGHNPLVGQNVDEWGVRFPDMTEPYSRRLMALAEETALAAGIRLRRGVYVGVMGPSLETAAETRFLRMIGGDAVGMSLVKEVITAVHARVEVLAISVITNVNLPDCYKPATIEDVIATANSAGEKFTRLLGKILEQI